MSTNEFLLSAWHWHPAVLMGCLGLIGGYAFGVRFRFPGRAWSWFAGIVLMLLATVSPAGELADRYLFSVHMAQHILFVLVIPALLLMGIPLQAANRWWRWGFARQTKGIFVPLPLAWLAGIGAMGFWHIPSVFNAAMSDSLLHALEPLSLLMAGAIYWWPILSPIPELRIKPVPHAAAYLFTSCLACTSMGILIAFAPSLLYPGYVRPVDSYGLLPVIRQSWGISAALDQQIGAMVMWVPGCLVYLTAIMAMFARWYAEEPENVPVEA